MAVGTTRERWVDLEGAANARDLGGLEIAGGGRTAPGVMLRSDNLQGLTERDVGRLIDEHGVRVVVDLRTREEVALEGPGPLVSDGRVDIRHRSLLPETGDNTDIAADAILPWQGRSLEGDPAEWVTVRSYLGYLRDRPDSIVAALRDVVESDAATVVHCAAGKDRTGVVCAFALASVGVPRDGIVADYVATGRRLVPLLARLRSSPTYAADLEGRPDAAHRPRPETMVRVLDVLEDRHGGAVGWLAEHGFGDDEQAALRRRLVA